MDIITSSILCITTAIWHEARGELDQDAMAAVADTIMVRAAQQDMMPCHVVHQPGQYAAKPINLESLAAEDLEAYDRARSIASLAFFGQGLGIHANHFHEASVHPSWARGQQPVGRIGSHLFYLLNR